MSNPYDPYSQYDPYRQPQTQQPNTYQQYSPEGSSNYDPYQLPQEGYQQQYSQSASAAYPPYTPQPVMVNIQQQVAQQQALYQPVLVAVPVRQTNGKATAAMVLGILCWVGFLALTGIPAVILGHMALGEINRSNGTQDGRGQAIAGLVMGYIAVGFLGLCILCYLAGAFATLGLGSNP